MVRLRIYFQFIFLLQLITNVGGVVKLDHPMVLLPFHYDSHSSRQEDFRLSASGGSNCFKWTVNPKYSVIKIFLPSPDITSRCPPDSSPYILIRPITPANVGGVDSKRQSAEIQAADIENPNDIAECSVFLNQIAEVQILTEARLFYVDVPEALRLQAFDIEGNVFSSLTHTGVSLGFEWEIGDQTVLQKITSKAAHMKLDNYRQEMENKNIQTDLFLVKGLKIGTSTVKISLRNPTPFMESNVTFSIVEHLCVEPSEIYISPFSEVDLLVKTKPQPARNLLSDTNKCVPCGDDPNLRSDGYTQHCYCKAKDPIIPMPDPHYKWSALNNSAFSLDQQGLVTGLRKGVGSATITDVICEGEHKETAKVHVVDPAMIKFRVGQQKCSKTYAVKGEAYVVEVFLFDDQGHGMIISNMQFKLNFEGDSVGYRPRGNDANNILSTCQMDIYATKYGVTTITATLDKIQNDKLGDAYLLSNVVSAVIEIIVSPPVQIVPRSLSLPWTTGGFPAGAVPTYMLQAQGGSGQYTWDEEDRTDSPITVSFDGLVTVGGPGNSRVHLRDTCIPNNNDSIPVLVSQALDLQFLPSLVEVQVGDTLDLVVIVTDAKGNKFTDCSLLHLTTLFDSSPMAKPDGAFYVIGGDSCHNDCPQNTSANCWVLQVQGKTRGFGTLHVGLADDHLHQKQERLLSAFLPLEIDPNALIHTIGSTSKLCWKNGPLEWPNSNYQSGAKISGPWNSKEKSPVSRIDQYHLSLDDNIQQPVNCQSFKCESQNEMTVRIRVGNDPSALNTDPVFAEMLVQYVCHLPLRAKPCPIFLSVGGHESIDIEPKVHKHIAYRIERSSIAVVDSKGTVTGACIGQTRLFTWVIGAPQIRTECKVIVHFKNFTIKAPTQHLLRNRQTIFHLEGINGEVPGDVAFESVQCQWYSNHPTLQLLPPFSQVQDKLHRSVNGFSVKLFPTRPGTNFNVTARIRVTEPHPNHENIASTFTQSIALVVIEPLELRSPSFLLLPYGSFSTVSTTTSPTTLSFETHDTSIATINSNGIITANANHDGDTVVLVKTRLVQSQTLAVAVSVRKVEQLGISPRDDLSGLVCPGKEITFNVMLLDRLGRTFNVEGYVGPRLIVNSSHNDILEAKMVPACTSPTSCGQKPPSDVLASVELCIKGTGTETTTSECSVPKARSKFFSTVVTISLANSVVNPLYLRIDVGDALYCGQVEEKWEWKMDADFNVEMMDEHEFLHTCSAAIKKAGFDVQCVSYPEASRWQTGIGVMMRGLPPALTAVKDHLQVNGIAFPRGGHLFVEGEPEVARLIWRMTSDVPCPEIEKGDGSNSALSIAPISQGKWKKSFEEDIALVLDISNDRIRVQEVQYDCNKVKIDILPGPQDVQSQTPDIHPDQWHLSPGFNVDNNSSRNLAHNLIRQMANKSSLLWQGRLSRYLQPWSKPKLTIFSRDWIRNDGNTWVRKIGVPQELHGPFGDDSFDPPPRNPMPSLYRVLALLFAFMLIIVFQSFLKR